MRSRNDHPSTGHDVLFSLPHTGVRSGVTSGVTAPAVISIDIATSPDIHRLAQQHRAMVVGTMLADAIIWIVRLPARIKAGLSGTALPANAPASVRR
jgi:hypothetical protein